MQSINFLQKEKPTTVKDVRLLSRLYTWLNYDGVLKLLYKLSFQYSWITRDWTTDRKIFM